MDQKRTNSFRIIRLSYFWTWKIRYTQFAITISVATVFSSINALTLSPSLCGLLLRPSTTKRDWFFTKFNELFDFTTKSYTGYVHMFVRRVALMMVFFAAVVGATAFGFMNVPGGFIPDEDQGYFFANVKLPDSASLERTEEVLDGITQTLIDTPGVTDVITIGGYSMLDSLQSSNGGAAIAVLENWSQRPDPELHATAIANAITAKLLQIEEGVAFAFIPPPIQGLGNAGGFELMLQDRGAAGVQQLQTFADDLAFEGNQNPILMRVNNSFRANVPQLYLDLDRTKAKTLGIQLSDIFDTLQAYLGSAYVNDFNIFGRTYRVMIQADAQFRSRVEDIRSLEVRDQAGNMIPLGTLMAVEDTVGPQAITRYNLYPAASITGSPRPGFSSGEAVASMQALSSGLLPQSMGYEWTGVTYQQLSAGNQDTHHLRPRFHLRLLVPRGPI